MTSLILPQVLRQELIEHAREDDPDEVCGMLAGRGNHVQRVRRVRNMADEVDRDRGVFRDRQTDVAAPGRRAVHYYMDPLDQLRAYDDIEDAGLDVVGYYHSHTHTEGRPSPTDIRLARDLGAYWILVSLQDAQNPTVRAWHISKADPMDETGEAIEIGIRDEI
ncbi:MAG: M67 family metallopeptidase [Chloroflexota bacterium]|nr:M67 family metallopeptidase [Chloroflexota bacterium]